jgi:AraC family transcriptional regulator
LRYPRDMGCDSYLDTAPLPTFLQTMQQGVYADFAKDVRKPESAAFTMMRIEQGAFESADPAFSDFYFGIADTYHVGFKGNGPGYRKFNNVWRDLAIKPSVLELTPPGSSVEYDIRVPSSLVILTSPENETKALMRRIAKKSVSDFGNLHECAMSAGPKISPLIYAIWHATSVEDQTQRLQADSLFTSLIVTCLQEAGHMKKPQDSDERLCKWQLKKAMLLINEQMTEPVTLASIATAMDMSEYHFLRAFRNTTGLPPHQYQIMLRVNMARQMIVRSKLGLSEIAFASGFSSHAHMTTTLKKWTGKTPAAYRNMSREI